MDLMSTFNLEKIGRKTPPLLNGAIKIIAGSILITTLGLLNGCSILRNIALLQSHWTLINEIPRLRRNLSKNRFVRFFECGHVVGHGLVIKFSTLKKVDLFPAHYINEDLPLGYHLSNLNIPIHIFSTLELSIRGKIRFSYSSI